MALAFTIMIPAGSGCTRPERTLQVWRQGARMEHVSRFEFEREPTREQWFTRVLDPAALPPGCIFPLSDRFEFLVVSKPAQWEQLLRATNLRDKAVAPDFHDGVVIGLMARVGEMRHDRWPILITSVRQRGRIAFLYAEFQEGFYRPLSVPPYLHLIYLHGADTFLGVKLNHLLFGFNVEIDDLNAVGIR